MTPNTPAEIAREIVAEMEGLYDYAAGMSISARPNFLWLQGRITAAVQAAERRAVERCAHVCDGRARYLFDLSLREVSRRSQYEHDAYINQRCAQAIRSLLAPDEKDVPHE